MWHSPGGKDSIKIRGFIAPKVFIFQFYQCNLELYKSVQARETTLNCREIFAQNFSGLSRSSF